MSPKPSSWLTLLAGGLRRPRAGSLEVVADALCGASPCPQCAYDLRGHPDETRCPECGGTVRISAAMAEANRWTDSRLLDLWSIGLLGFIGTVCAVISLAAIRQGQYVALILGIAGGIYLACASIWFLVLLEALVHRKSRPSLKVLPATRRARLFRWYALDAAMLAGVPVGLLLLF